MLEQGNRLVSALALAAALGGIDAAAASARTGGEDRLATYANPVDLPYRYQFGPFREAADPTIVRFKDRYWLFASHSKGYWWSTDLLHWTFVEPTGYQVNRYAPTVMVMNGRMYLAASENAKKIWVTDDPMGGAWTEAADISPGYNDPCLFLDDDGRLYMYEGLSGTEILRVYELDPKTFQPLRRAEVPQSRSKETRGWEVVGDRNENERAPSFIEGSWMTKYKGRYYLQYAAPGTEYKTYGDGVLVSDNPMGPFRYEPNSPFAFKPTGFIAGAGHGSTFQGADGRWWHAGTMTISQRFRFERRLGLFPTAFTRDGVLATDTYLGDYPHYIGGNRGLTGWMLLSRRKAVTVSSTLDGFPAGNAVDEEVRTWWSAKTGGANEWLQIDLGARKRIEAVQINFADQDSRARGISRDVYRYVLEASDDGQSWRVLIDQSAGGRDAPHDYRVLPKADQARFVRLRNVHMPDGAKFSLYDLRVFGRGNGPAPARVTSAAGARDPSDARKATISWRPAKNAEFYVVRLGTRPDLMTQNYQVYDGATTLSVPSLNAGVSYYFAVDAVNERGITRGRVVAAPIAAHAPGRRSADAAP